MDRLAKPFQCPTRPTCGVCLRVTAQRDHKKGQTTIASASTKILTETKQESGRLGWTNGNFSSIPARGMNKTRIFGGSSSPCKCQTKQAGRRLHRTRRIKEAAEEAIAIARAIRDWPRLEVLCNKKVSIQSQRQRAEKCSKWAIIPECGSQGQTTRRPGVQRTRIIKGKYLKIKLTLSEEEPRSAGGRVLVALSMQRLRNRGRAAEEDTNIRIGVFLCQGREHTVPVGSTEMRWSPEGGNRVLLSPDILDLTQE